MSKGTRLRKIPRRLPARHPKQATPAPEEGMSWQHRVILWIVYILVFGYAICESSAP